MRCFRLGVDQDPDIISAWYYVRLYLLSFRCIPLRKDCDASLVSMEDKGMVKIVLSAIHMLYTSSSVRLGNSEITMRDQYPGYIVSLASEEWKPKDATDYQNRVPGRWLDRLDAKLNRD